MLRFLKTSPIIPWSTVCFSYKDGRFASLTHFMVADLMLYEEVIEKVARGHLLGLFCSRMLNTMNSETMATAQMLWGPPCLKRMVVVLNGSARIVGTDYIVRYCLLMDSVNNTRHSTWGQNPS